MNRELTISVMALTDAAPFLVAQHLGLFDEHSLQVRLNKHSCWASLQDEVVKGRAQAAHMHSPMAIALHFGLGGTPRLPMHAPLVLSRGGPAITLRNSLARVLGQQAIASNLGDWLRAEKQAELPTRVFATVHPFSVHTILLRRWMRANQIDPDFDVRMEVLQPTRMPVDLALGGLDGYCSGEPFNSLAVDEGLAEIMATSQCLWHNVPDKVLAFNAHWAEAQPELAKGLELAITDACNWLASSEANRMKAAEWVADRKFLDVPQRLVEQALTDKPNSPGVGAEPALQPKVHFEGRPFSQRDLPVLDELMRETFALDLGR